MSRTLKTELKLLRAGAGLCTVLFIVESRKKQNLCHVWLCYCAIVWFCRPLMILILDSVKGWFVSVPFARWEAGTLRLVLSSTMKTHKMSTSATCVQININSEGDVSGKTSKFMIWWIMCRKATFWQFFNFPWGQILRCSNLFGTRKIINMHALIVMWKT